MDKKYTEDDAIERLIEWQNHHNIPGYYTGGNLPPTVTNRNRPGLMGTAYLIDGLLITSLILIIDYFGFKSKQFFDFDAIEIIATILANLMLLSFGIVSSIGGIRLLGMALNSEKEKKVKHHSKHQKKHR